ncbi:MAG: ribosome maturation factor RimM [Syntrophorhabdaceae bacterium]|nr:ribosome maturation factor RimM [Syntrophorhabdaceae bacterium]
MKYVPIGRITSAHGVKGEVKFYYYNEKKEVFYSYTSFFIQKDGLWFELKPVSKRPYKNVFIIKFKGLERLEDVESLIKNELYVRKKDLPKLDEDEYYVYELVGMEVFDEDGEKIGTVSGIIRTGSNDCLDIKGHKDILVPMVEEYIISIDRKHSRVIIRSSPFS